jgi:polysaccharide export outer membrane protein
MKNQKHYCHSLLAILVALVSVILTSCQTGHPTQVAGVEAEHTESLILREGDVLKITFPGSPNLDATQPIRRDGKIVLSLVGEVPAVGLTPDELQKKLIELFAPQISSREVVVVVESSSFPVYVTGQVIHPGKIQTDHPLTALEAVMEAGGFDFATANLKSVKITRTEKGATKAFKLDLKRALDGKEAKPFYLKPGDILFVPERLQVF